jgi:pyridoxamine 5'-phosphate oxidase
MENQELESLIKTTRVDFTRNVLSKSEAEKDPFRQFSKWLEEAFRSGNNFANAMVFSTVAEEGMPSSRVMLLRDISYGGFTFFTNYTSKKGQELDRNNKAALLFFWPELERQVRIQGSITTLPEKESDFYFMSRPFESQVGAWASEQSTTVKDREEIESRYIRLVKHYENGKVPRPAHWGGYVLIPQKFEFWQGRASRLHDRLQYSRGKNPDDWEIERLMP